MALPSTRAAAPIRRFIYLIMDGGNDSHTVHRIDTTPLFTSDARAQHGPQAPPPPPRAALPSPLARIGCAAGRQFLPLGRGVERLVGVHRHRHTVIIDLDTRTGAVRAGPDAHHAKWFFHGDTWAAGGHAGRLFHLGRGPGYEEQEWLDLEALTYDPCRDDWAWSVLRSPPLDDEYSLSMSTIRSFADAGGDASASESSAIRISTWDGTYAFDAARASWRKEGGWLMPFSGRAQYVADYGLWFGFTGDRRQASGLGAADLNVVGRPPVCRHAWDNVDGYGNHAGVCVERSYLGSGRFCVTRFFREEDSHDGRDVMVAAASALEVTRAAASATGTGETRLQMARRATGVRALPKPVRFALFGLLGVLIDPRLPASLFGPASTCALFCVKCF